MTTTNRTTIELNQTRNNATSNSAGPSLSKIPRSWLIAAVAFYCASVITVGLLAGLVPQRTQYITIYGTLAPPNSTTIAPITTTRDTHVCIDDECNPRLSNDLTVDSYDIEYIYNDTTQTTVEGQVTIQFTLKKPAKQLIYHAQGMDKLEEPALFEDEVYRFINMRTYVPNDYISLNLTTGGLFASNRYKLVQKFIVKLNNNFAGFYESVFPDNNGATTG